MFDGYYPNQFGPGRSAVICQHGAVATSQPLAAQGGLQILREGGNAIDAAVATAAILNVVEPMSTGIGGDAFMLVYQPKEGVIRGLNASGRAPYAAELEFFTKQGLRSIPAFGSMYPVTVPGTIDGWATLLEACGTMSLVEVLQPAIDYAENGFPVSPQISLAWQGSATMLAQHPDTAKTYLTNGKAPEPGEVFQQPNFARTLRLIAEGGRDAFYHGEIADKIVQFSDENGGLFTRQDFADHKSDWVEPISTNYRGYDVYEIPPNGQGIAALLALNIVEGFDLDFNMDVQNALDAPRFRVMDDSRIMLEAGIPMNVQAALAQRGHHIIPVTRLSPVRIRDGMDVRSAIERSGIFFDFRLELRYNIKTNRRFGF